VNSKKALLDAIAVLDQKKTYGACVIIDEAGADMNKQKYYEEMMQVVNESIQILGYLKAIIIFVSPRRNFIMSSLRQMTHYHFYSKRNSNEFTHLTPYELKYNAYKEEPYKKHPKVILFGQKIVLARLKISKAPEWLVERYQQLELQRKPALLAKLRERGIESEIVEKKQDIDKLIDLVVEHFEDYKGKRFADDNVILNVFRIKGRLKIPMSDAEYIKSEAEPRIRKILRERKEAAEKAIKGGEAP